MQQHELLTPNNEALSVRIWPCDNAKGTVQILHGMAEHCQRYEGFAQFLNEQGFTVLSHNHLGHGERTPAGHFADEQGWEKVLDDVALVQTLASPDLPIFLFGHSMGSFIARSFVANKKHRLAGLILSGSNQEHPALFHIAGQVAKLQRLVQGKRQPSKLMDYLSFGSFNQHFKPNITQFDWLSRDLDQVQKYIDDPECGRLSSTQFWVDFMGALVEVTSLKGLRGIPAKLPILLVGGDEDPVGRMGKGLPELAQALNQTGHKTVALRLYPKGRHEMLNETNAKDVMRDIALWLNACTNG